MNEELDLEEIIEQYRLILKDMIISEEEVDALTGIINKLLNEITRLKGGGNEK